MPITLSLFTLSELTQKTSAFGLLTSDFLLLTSDFRPPTPSIINQFPQINRDNTGYPLLNHGYSVNNIGAGNGAFVVRNDNELRLGREFADYIIEFINI